LVFNLFTAKTMALSVNERLKGWPRFITKENVATWLVVKTSLPDNFRNLALAHLVLGKFNANVIVQLIDFVQNKK
jgi:hypothetical protein